MTTGVETAVSGARLDRRGFAHGVAVATAGWLALRTHLKRWSTRQRMSRGIAHLNDRLLADAGLTPEDLGFGERLIRSFGRGGSIRAVGEADYQS
jgi:uncharacterized protein YjiS (DUF1127 family)